MIPETRTSGNIRYEPFIEHAFNDEIFYICPEQGLCHSSTCQSRAFLIRGTTFNGGTCQEAAYCLSANDCPNNPNSFNNVMNTIFANDANNKLTYEACFKENSKRLLTLVQKVNMDYNKTKDGD